MRFILALTTFLVAVAGFNTSAHSFESGDMVTVGTYCETVAETRLFLMGSRDAKLCYTVKPRFPCKVIEDVDVVGNITIASCSPHPDAIDRFGLPETVYSFYKLKGIDV